MSSENSDTRNRILKTTAQMLEEHGGRGVRMSDIAKQTGISRQAVYLHFASRAELLTATTRYRDEELGLEDRLAPSRSAASGVERLRLYVAFWGEYLPQIYGIAKALLLAQDTDPAAAAAWRDRMDAHRDGCRAAVDALHADGVLADQWTQQSGTDMLWALLCVESWEHLTIGCNWSSKEYVQRLSTVAEGTLVKHQPG